MIRVGVIGAAGRMGQLVCRAVVDADDLGLAAAIDRSRVGQPIGPLIGRPELDVPLSDELDRLLEAEVEVAVDFTHPDVVRDTIRWCVEHAVNLVVGTSGITADDLEDVRRTIEAEGAESNVIVVSNFALGAVLMQRFAAMAAAFFPDAEIVELHHQGKADAPSGTAIATAERLVQARRAAGAPAAGTELVAGVRGGQVEGVRIHSVRLPGLVAHQEVIFGGQGQTLTIRHDSTDRTSFMPGILLAIRAAATRRGLTVGLEPLLDPPPTVP
ncbi:MAG: 4-hydroxy-tetrahydrodipicolinate reductase [Candidatus Velamenicoccus archaeovorus]